MRLISCHIQNFGKLHDFTYSFNQDMNVIHEDNGWGKSTFATYIRVMFYGFLGEKKRNNIENERKKYKPWQMGTYGGDIVFSVGSKEYRMERRFGDKSSGSDEFVLYDNTTNLKSSDYSLNIGEELFGIDIESFMRTVFIAQQDCGTKVTPNISAKIGNVSDQTADMGRYDDVQNALKKEMDSLTPGRATGRLYKIQTRMSELREKVRNKDNYTTSLDELEKNLDEQIKEKARSQEELRKIQKEIERVSSIKDAQAGVEKYKELCEQEALAKEKYEGLKKCFPKSIPDKSDIESNITQCDEYERLLQTVKNNTLSNEEQNNLERFEDIFAPGIPDEDTLTKVETDIDTLAKLVSERDAGVLSDVERKKLADSREVFSNYKPSLEEMDDLLNKWGERKTKKETLSTKKASAELLKNANASNGTSGKTLGLAILIIGIVAAFGGVIAIIAAKIIAIGAVIAGIGAIAAIVGAVIAFGKKAGNVENNSGTAYEQIISEIRRDEEYVQDVEQSCKELFDKLGIGYNEHDVPSEISRIRGLLKDYDELEDRSKRGDETQREEKIELLDGTISEFFRKYKSETAASDYQKVLCRIQNDITEYGRIIKKCEIVKSTSEEADSIKKTIEEYVHSLGLEVGENLKNQLSEIKDKCKDLKNAEEGLERCRTRREAYEEEVDVSEFEDKEGVSEGQSLEALNKSFNAIQERINQLAELEEKFRGQMDDVSRNLEVIEDDEAELANLKEEYDEAKKRFDIIVKTRDYLEKAKQNFSGKYMADIKESFEKYHSIISDGDDKYELDANLNIQLKEKGGLHEIEFLSEGYKDLVGLCRRMAMVDAMYDKEKPILILDDPFVNFDERRLSGAIEFLDLLARDYQIIYFACHKSRCR
ncbi:MAG: hypothetical protein E7241_11070 [Lachnospiraceae bacterium]|nr:hypothetical protein [Lachnospiraceae bacterium]